MQLRDLLRAISTRAVDEQNFTREMLPGLLMGGLDDDAIRALPQGGFVVFEIVKVPHVLVGVEGDEVTEEVAVHAGFLGGVEADAFQLCLVGEGGREGGRVSGCGDGKEGRQGQDPEEG